MRLIRFYSTFCVKACTAIRKTDWQRNINSSCKRNYYCFLKKMVSNYSRSNSVQAYIIILPLKVHRKLCTMPVFIRQLSKLCSKRISRSYTRIKAIPLPAKICRRLKSKICNHRNSSAGSVGITVIKCDI